MPRGSGLCRCSWERWHLLDRSTPRVLLAQILDAMPDGPALMLDLKGPRPTPVGRRLPDDARLARTGQIGTLHSLGSRRQLRVLMRRQPRRLTPDDPVTAGTLESWRVTGAISDAPHLLSRARPDGPHLDDRPGARPRR